jgi:hypothetical protein
VWEKNTVPTEKTSWKVRVISRMNRASVLSFITKDSSKHEGLVLAQEKEKLHAANARNYFSSNIFSRWGTLEKWKNSKIILPLSTCAFTLERSEYCIMHGLSHVYRPWSPHDYWWQEKTLYCGFTLACLLLALMPSQSQACARPGSNQNPMRPSFWRPTSCLGCNPNRRWIIHQKPVIRPKW